MAAATMQPVTVSIAAVTGYYYLLNLLIQPISRDRISSKLTESLLTPATEPVAGLAFTNSPITNSSFRAINGRNFSHGTLSRI